MCEVTWDWDPNSQIPKYAAGKAGNLPVYNAFGVQCSRATPIAYYHWVIRLLVYRNLQLIKKPQGQ